MIPLSCSLDCNCVDMVGNEARVDTSCVTECLVHHSAQHGDEARRVAIVMVVHGMEGSRNVHLFFGDGDEGVEKIEIGKLAIDAVVEDVEVREAASRGVVDYYNGLDGAGFEGEGRDEGGSVGIMIGIDPGLGAGAGVGGD